MSWVRAARTGLGGAGCSENAGPGAHKLARVFISRDSIRAALRSEVRLMRFHCGLGLLLLTLAGAGAFGSQEQRVFQLTGKIVGSNGKPLRYAWVLLFSARSPFNVRTLADSAGEFRFRALPAGVYNLSVIAGTSGEINQTIEVGPSFADKKGRLTARIVFDQAKAVRARHGVSVIALSVPDKAKQEYLKAMSLAEKRDFDGAAKRLRHAVEIAPQFSAAWNFLGTMSFQAGAFQQAEKYFREALKQDDTAFDPLVNLGGALIALHRYEESLPVNLQAVKIRSNDALAQSQLGQSYFHLGRMEEAETHLKLAKGLDPSHFSLPQIVLSDIYRSRGNYVAAIQELEECLNLHPDSATAPYVRKQIDALRALIK